MPGLGSIYRAADNSGARLTYVRADAKSPVFSTKNAKLVWLPVSLSVSKKISQKKK